MTKHGLADNAAEERVIGGYFGLEIAGAPDRFLPSAKRFQSGRAALQAFLAHRMPRRLWLPRYGLHPVPKTPSLV
jgi:hypothetical protein